MAVTTCPSDTRTSVRVMSRSGPRYTPDQAAAAIAASWTYAETLRRLGMCTTGGNHQVLRRYAEEVWHISTAHFDPDRARAFPSRERIPLERVIVGARRIRGGT